MVDDVLNGVRARLLPDEGGDDGGELQAILVDLEPKIRKLVKAFRKKLTPKQNEQWDDQQIVTAFMLADKAPEFIAGLYAKHLLLDTSSKELAGQPEFYEAVFGEAKLYAALRSHATKFWNLILVATKNQMSRGKYLRKAPKGKGLLVSGGHDEETLADIAAHEQENIDGHNQRGDFVPGSGGLEMNVEGKIVDADPVFSMGIAPDADEPDADAEARRIRNAWLNERSDATAA